MSKIKKIVSILLICTVIMGLNVNVFAKETEITPYYVVSCDGGGKHTMYGRGIGTVYEGSVQNPGSKLIYGFANQCTKCNLVLISEGRPKNGVIGQYRLVNPGYQISNYGIIEYGGITDAFYGNLAQDSFWAGFEFYGS